MRVTLDTNAIIDLEANGKTAHTMRKFVALHCTREIELCVSAIAASERDRDPAGEPNFAKFTAKLAGVGLSEVELLNPTWHWGVTYWGHCVFGELGDTLEPDIGNILFHDLNVAESVPDEGGKQFDKRTKKARNALCDILSMWCHIRYHSDVFVTSDKNFHKASKKPLLIALGAGQILNASDALAFVKRTPSISQAPIR